MSFFFKKTKPVKDTDNPHVSIHPAIHGKPLRQLSVEQQIPTQRPKNISDIEHLWKSIPFWAENYFVYNRFLCKYEEVYVTDKGIIFNKKRVFEDTILYEGHYEKFSLRFLKKEIEKKRKKVLDNRNYLVIYNYWSVNYFHWMIDDLIKLLAIQDHCGDMEFSLLIPTNAPDFVLKSLPYFGFPIAFFDPSEYLAGKNLYSINNLSPSGLCHPLIKKLPALFNAGKKKKGDKKIYVSRAKSTIRHIANDEKLLPILQKHGFEVVYNELLSFEQQLMLFSQAKTVIAPHGAGLTNTLFMNAGGTVIELASENILNQPTCYWNLANMIGHSYYYVPCQWDTEKNGYRLTDDTLCYIDELLKKA